ncbi:hypothetical protein HPB52_019922 [Rhipicephalus sanguineus]|uniref:Uncharacterized protein n=1 Tax=Rhipicephalus sanguineus TaxID=34632 RepID=A0A9D4QB06_RHISA|nr:hypothetical protein HPB52_019922 [Rhipicephalus sanguineus]
MFGRAHSGSPSTLSSKQERAAGHPLYEKPESSIILNGTLIPKVETSGALGLHIHKDGTGATSLPRLQRTPPQFTHLVKRIPSQRIVLKEHDTLRIKQALLTTRIAYGRP